MSALRIGGVVLFIIAALYFLIGQPVAPEEAGYGVGAVGFILALFGRTAAKQLFLLLLNNAAFREAFEEVASDLISGIADKLYDQLSDQEDAIVDRIIGLHPDLNEDGTVEAGERREALRVYVRDVLQTALVEVLARTRQ